MDLEEFRASLKAPTPPANAIPLLVALWSEARGDWERAHEIAQAEGGPDGAWVHAYLHRKEGDLPNASYWYRHAGREMPEESLEAEWDEIARFLLEP